MEVWLGSRSEKSGYTFFLELSLEKSGDTVDGGIRFSSTERTY